MYVEKQCSSPLTVSNFSVRETGSKKALFFIHNDTPKLSPPKYFDSSKNRIYSAAFFFRAILGRYLQLKFEMLKIIIMKKKNPKKSNMKTYQNMSKEW